ncbi:MAG TPA: hypothetical protein VIU62_00455 [Chloroflexota bacterium]
MARWCTPNHTQQSVITEPGAKVSLYDDLPRDVLVWREASKG